MLKNSQTKVIMPALAFGVLQNFLATGRRLFNDTQVRSAYQQGVRSLKQHFGHDGVDLATNFGVVYQVKKLRVATRSDADKLYSELKLNFDQERLQDGNVILVIDEIAEDVRRYLIDVKVQSIKTDHLMAIAKGLEDPEDRQKVLRVIYEEFRRDYSSTIT